MFLFLIFLVIFILIFFILMFVIIFIFMFFMLIFVLLCIMLSLFLILSAQVHQCQLFFCILWTIHIFCRIFNASPLQRSSILGLVALVLNGPLLLLLDGRILGLMFMNLVEVCIA